METKVKNVSELQGAVEPQLQRDVCWIQHEVTNDGCRCGKQNHKPAQWPFRTARCHNCGKVGHIKKVCWQPKRPPTSQERWTQRHPVRTVQEGIEDPDELSYVLHTDRAQSGQPLDVDLMVDGKPLRMEIDTGAAVSIGVREDIQESLSRTLRAALKSLFVYLLGRIDHSDRTGGSGSVLWGAASEGSSAGGQGWRSKFAWTRLADKTYLEWGVINTVKSKTLTSVLERATQLCV